MNKGDKLTVVAIGAAGLALVHVAFEDSGGLLGRFAHLPEKFSGSVLTLVSWEYFPAVMILVGVFGFVLLTLRK